MAITFSCNHCGKSLSTSDDKAGRKAKCPGCGEVLTVPESVDAASDNAFDDEGDHDADAEAGDFPDAPPPLRKKSSSAATGTKTCPMCGAENPRKARKCDACGEEFDVDAENSKGPRGAGITFDPSEVISASWQIYKREMGIVLGAVLIAGIVSNIVSAPSIIIEQINNFQLQQGQNPDPTLVMLYWLFLIPAQLFAIFLNIGVVKVLFKVARGKDASIGEIFSGGKYFLRMLGSTILFVLMMLLGIIACVIPGILVGLMFWPFAYVLVDEDPEGINCLWRAKEITRGNWGSAFVLGIAAMGISLLGMLACCVGVIFTAPLAQLLFAVAYCRMTGQRTAE